MNLNLYKNLISETSKNYKFCKINNELNQDDLINGNENICFLRHDIDYSPSNAVKIAGLEADQEVFSTFTVLLTGEFYNPLEPANRKIIKEIRNLGHEVGLHFDPSIYSINSEKELHNFIHKEASLLEDIVESKVEMFSFHNTTEFSMSCRKNTYGNLINSYSSFFHDSVDYISDSNGYWRFRSWEELLEENKKLIQILTHPIWWKEKNFLPPFETIIENCLERYKNQISIYTKLFDGQKVRENKSALSYSLKKLKKDNDSSILNVYSKYEELIKLLMNDPINKDEDDLKKISEDFFEK